LHAEYYALPLYGFDRGALYTLGYTRGAAEPKPQRLANHSAETQINNIRFSAKPHRSETLQSSQGRHATHGSSNKTECTSHPGGLSEHRHSLRVDFVRNIDTVRPLQPRGQKNLTIDFVLLWTRLPQGYRFLLEVE